MVFRKLGRWLDRHLGDWRDFSAIRKGRLRQRMARRVAGKGI